MKKIISNTSSRRRESDYLIPLERIISEFSTWFANASANEIVGNIDQALKQIVECLDLERCAFWEMSENGTDVKISHQYAVPGAEKIPQGVNYKNFPWIFQKALAKDYVCFGGLEDLPEEAVQDKEFFRLLGTKSAALIPYYIGGKAIAGMTFAAMTQHKTFPPDLIAKLKLIGEIITGAFYRQRMEENYQKDVRDALGSDTQIHVADFALRNETKNEFNYEGVIGQSAAMKLVFSRVDQVAPTDAVVLILGETGTGKGVIARIIHQLSKRNKGRFVSVNCAALTPSLIESELFGREKGAYTGCTEKQVGRFELADQGTLILDEIAELPLDLQAKLLTAIQDGEFERLGSPKTIKVDVRIIALTSRNLKEEISRGRFRQDLYYRLNVFPITMPPLRERIEDIPIMAEYFVTQCNRRMQKEIKSIPKQVMEELVNYSWPGNVRELQHLIERAVITTTDTSLHLTEKLVDAESAISEELCITNLAEVEKRHILKVLEKVNGRIDGPKGAAVLLGLHGNTLRARMQKFGIRAQKNS